MSDQKAFSDLAETIRTNTAPAIMHVEKGSDDKAPFALVPNGMTVKDIKPFLDAYKEKPDRRTGVSITDDLVSFIDLTNRFKAENSAIFGRCEIDGNKIDAHLQAILDYHPMGPDNKDAAFGEHKIDYKFPISQDCAFWLENNKTPMNQLEFALLLEERMMDLAVPGDDDVRPIEGLNPRFADPLGVLDLAKSLELYSNETFKSKNKLQSGETEFKFSSEHVDSDGKPVKIPDFFIIHIPLFEGGAPERLPVRLRYRLNQGKLVWFYDLYRIDLAFLNAYENACAVVKKETDLPLYKGLA